MHRYFNFLISVRLLSLNVMQVEFILKMYKITKLNNDKMNEKYRIAAKIRIRLTIKPEGIRGRTRICVTHWCYCSSYSTSIVSSTVLAQCLL
jgi:hypothetical protein